MLDIHLLRYELRAPQLIGLKAELPSATLRGAFGYALLDLLADDGLGVMDGEREQIEEFFGPDPVGGGNAGFSVPRPVVFRGGYTDPSGQQVGLELLLFGEIRRFERVIDRVVERMADRGVGGGFGHVRCEVVSRQSIAVVPQFPAAVHRVVVDYLSPTRIQYGKVPCQREIPFEALVSRLSDRFAALVAEYGTPDARDWTAWRIETKRMARLIESYKLDGGRAEIRRRSTRTGGDCALNGFVGQMLYQGQMDYFSEILAHLPFIHVGKSAAFGCGWTSVECYSVEASQG